jgi:hypothetical protein
MKQFVVFRHPNGQIEAVKHGWSWPAFFCSVFWAFGTQLWLRAVLWFLILASIDFVSTTTFGDDADPLVAALSIAVGVIFGVNGNAWRRSALQSRGFDIVDNVTASNAEDAIALFLHYIKGHGRPAGSPGR